MVNVHCALFIDDERKTRSYQSVSEASRGNLDYAGSVLLYGLRCINLVCFDEIKISCQSKKWKRKL